uniref:THAP-type domain-containing protein n=1 Tax=Pygocentrus nattereri TaxID=42514 RepID=A0A3B4BTC3_PYGNA
STRSTHSKCYCSATFCSNSRRKQPHLSFHDLPRDEHVRVKWIRAIRRDEGGQFAAVRGSRVGLKKGSVPSRFAWNEFGTHHTREPVLVSVSQR